jgi:nucleoside-diphosphate-sugar epimerase
MKVLVTGASGLLGGAIAELLADRGDTVRALVRRTSKRSHLEKLPNIEFFEASLDQPERLNAAVAGVDAIIHSAGLVKARDADEFFSVNVGGTSNLVEAARLRGSELRRFVYVSSL